MKEILSSITLTLVALTLSGCAVYPQYPQYAQPNYVYSQPVSQQGYYVNRSVPSYEPRYQQSQTYNDGYYNQPNGGNYYNNRQITPNTGGAVIGAAAGGILGGTVGRGNGRNAASAVGAATGAIVGSGCRSINGGQVIGGIAGALLGNTIGKGSGRTAASGVGAAMGAMVGNDMAGGCVGN